MNERIQYRYYLNHINNFYSVKIGVYDRTAKVPQPPPPPNPGDGPVLPKGS